MDLMKLIRRAEKFSIDNSPLILTAVGAAGVLTTGVFAWRGGYNAALEIVHAEMEANKEYFLDETGKVEYIEFTAKERVNLVWQKGIPALSVGAITIAAVVGANKISTKRAAAMAAAFSLTNEAFDEYKEKVREKLGDRKEREVHTEVAQERVNANPPTKDNTIIVTHDGDQLFEDSWSGRYFKSNAESIHQAVNQLNHSINKHGSATLTDFYDLLGLKKTAESDEIGWNADKLLEIYLDAVMHDDGRQSVLAIEYRVTPIRDYFRTR